MGASKPTVFEIGFYVHKELGAAEIGILSTLLVHKECRAAEIRILSTQQIPRGRGPILSTQMFYGACFKKNVLRKMSAIVKSISALRALVLKNLLRTMSEVCLTYKLVCYVVRSAYWERC